MADPRVMYSEPAKFVAKLRDMKTDENVVLFKCELCAGHSSKSGRYFLFNVYSQISTISNLQVRFLLSSLSSPISILGKRGSC